MHSAGSSSFHGASRLAPSPSGALHIGNACTFLVNWALARSRGWELVLRIEDLDRPRVRPGAEEEILASLAWLGIDFDRTAPHQSRRGDAYEAAVELLAAQALLFASPHSRAEVRAAAAGASDGGSDRASDRAAPAAPAAPASPARDDDDREASPASAPHASAPALRFPRSLRPPPGEAWSFRSRTVNHRFRVPDEAVEVSDELMGRHRFALAVDPGDPIVWSKAGVAAYQLAVVVDDAASGVTDVVRGEDLLPSAAIQAALARALGHPVPRWWHVPLVVDEEGRRLSKRDGDLSLAALRSRGVPPERVIGLAAWWIDASKSERPTARSIAEFRELCTVERLRAWHRAPRPRLDAAARTWLESGG